MSNTKTADAADATTATTTYTRPTSLVVVRVDLPEDAGAGLAEGFGHAGELPVVRLDVYRGGRRVSVHVDVIQHVAGAAHTKLRVNVGGRSRTVTKTAALRPWVEPPDA